MEDFEIEEQDDGLPVLTRKTTQESDGLPILKKKVDGEPSSIGIRPTSQSNSSLASTLQSGQELASGQIFKNVPATPFKEAAQKDKDRNQSYLGAVWNNIVGSAERLAGGAARLADKFEFNPAADAEKKALDIASQTTGVNLRAVREKEISDKFKNFIGKAKTNASSEEHRDKLLSGFDVTNGVGVDDLKALGVMLPAMIVDMAAGAATSGSSFAIQGYDDALSTLDKLPEAKNMNEGTRTAFGLGGGVVAGVLEKLGLDNILKSGTATRYVTAKVIKETAEELAKKGAKITSEELEQAVAAKATDLLKNTALKNTVKAAAKSALIEGTTEATQEGAMDLLKIAANKLEGKDIFDTKEMKNTAASRYLNNAVVGGLMGGVAGGAFSRMKNLERHVQEQVSNAQTQEDIDKISAEINQNIQDGTISQDEGNKLVGIIHPENNKPINATTIAPVDYTPETKGKSISVILPQSNVNRETVSGRNIKYNGDNWTVTKDLGDTVEISKDNGSKIVVKKEEIPDLNITPETQPTLLEQDVAEDEIQHPAENKKSTAEEVNPIIEPTKTEPDGKGKKRREDGGQVLTTPQNESTGGNPPKEPPVTGTSVTEPELMSVKHAETDRVAKELGLPEYEKDPTTFPAWNAEADKRIKENPNAVSELLAKLKKGDKPDAPEQYIMAKYLASLKNKINGDPLNNKLLTEFKTAKDLSDKIGGRAVAESLVARRDMVAVDDSIAGMMVREMEVSGVDELTDAQKEKVVSEHTDLTKKTEEAQAKIKILEEENAKLKAEAELKKTTKSTPSAKKSKEDITKVRESLKESIKDKWKKAANDGTLTAVPLPYAKQLAAIAPDVSKLVKNYVEEGVTNLGEVVKKVIDDIREFIPEITEKDVHDIIAGEYNEKKKTKNQLAAKVKDLKDEAALINKLERLLSGIEPKNEKAKIERNKEIKELQGKIKSFRKEESEANKFYSEEIPSDLSKLRAAKNRLETQAKDVQEKIKNGEYEPEVKKSFPILENKELQKKYPKEYKEALAAQDALIKLKQEREVRLLKQEYANRSKSDKAKDAALELLNVPRAIMSSFDFSAPLRQAVIPTIAHPKIAVGAVKNMFEHAFSQKSFDRWFDTLRKTEDFKVMDKAGLYVSDPHNYKLSAKEEMFMNNLAEKIPIAGRFIKGSERAYVSYLNKMRVDLFKNGQEVLEAAGKTPENSPKDYEGLASYVNNQTGRGGMSESLENAAPILNSMFFSPRLIASRLNILGLSDVATGGNGYYSKLPPEVRKMAAKDLIKFVGFGMSLLGLAAINGANVETDPRSADFGKIRVGDTRYDIWGGNQQYVRFLAQMISGQTKSSTTGRIKELNGKQQFGKTRADLALSFLRGKLAPVPSMAWDFAQGRTTTGEKTSISDEVLSHFTPLIYSDLKEAINRDGISSVLTVGLPATFGVGVQTYDSKKNKPNGTGGGGASGNF